MKKEHISEIQGILILAAGMILLASLISFVPSDLSWYTSRPNLPPKNLISITGAYTAGTLFFLIGYTSYFLVIFLFFWSWNKFLLREIKFNYAKFFSLIVLLGVVSGLFGLMGPAQHAARFSRAGLTGLLISDFLLKYGNPTGAYIFLTTLAVMCLIITGEFLVTPFFLSFVRKLKDLPALFGKKALEKNKEERPKIIPVPEEKKKKDLLAILKEQKLINFFKAKENQLQPDALKEKLEKKLEKFDAKNVETSNSSTSPDAKGLKPKITIAPTSTGKATTDKEEPEQVGEYVMPSLDLLKSPPTVSTAKIQTDLMSGAKLLEETLASFGVVARVADIERGPAITRYELEPAPGVKVHKFTTLADDIALAMRAASVRIVAPIPGKNRVGIEVPNGASASVFLKEVIASDKYSNSHSKLTLALGKDLGGQPMVADLADMPHMLIAGTTGSGKSVCVNGIIMSILFNASPDEVKFVMVDPKMVELSIFADIPHLLCPPVTDSKKAAGVLNWVVTEMENRYSKLSKAGAKNIKGFNEKGNKMPYIVVVIDELADLMQVSAKTVESSITRLAQLSRAVGIHLILATQRPSVDVITGVIKANFPARISFKVASKVDSRTVLDMNGAESLLGKGDMLFIKPGDAKPTRGQCCYVSDEELHKVIDVVKGQQKPIYDDNILNQQKTGVAGESGEKDEFYDEAVRLVMETSQASVSILQRRLRLGYTRAARLIDMMEQNGLVGPYCGSKPREILVDREQWMLDNMNSKTQEAGQESA